MQMSEKDKYSFKFNNWIYFGQLTLKIHHAKTQRRKKLDMSKFDE